MGMSSIDVLFMKSCYEGNRLGQKDIKEEREGVRGVSANSKKIRIGNSTRKKKSCKFSKFLHSIRFKKFLNKLKLFFIRNENEKNIKINK